MGGAGNAWLGGQNILVGAGMGMLQGTLYGGLGGAMGFGYYKAIESMGKPLPAFSEENFSDPPTGIDSHNSFLKTVAQQTGTNPKNWRYRNYGPDLEWIGEPEENPYPGIRWHELKPLDRAGYEQFCETPPNGERLSQLHDWWCENGGPIQDGESIHLWGYDRQGNIMPSGRIWTFRGNTEASSFAPGYRSGFWLRSVLGSSVVAGIVGSSARK